MRHPNCLTIFRIMFDLKFRPRFRNLFPEEVRDFPLNQAFEKSSTASWIIRRIGKGRNRTFFHKLLSHITKENIFEWNLLEKSWKRPFCCTVSILQVYFTYFFYITKENRIYILEGNLLEKSVKRPFCCTVSILQSAGVLHTFVLYNLLGPGISFYRKSKINVIKVNQIMK